MKLYEKILQDMGFSREDDERAAKIMKDLAGEKLLDCSVLEFIRGKSVAVIGGAYRREITNEELLITAGKAINRVDFTLIYMLQTWRKTRIFWQSWRRGVAFWCFTHTAIT